MLPVVKKVVKPAPMAFKVAGNSFAKSSNPPNKLLKNIFALEDIIVNSPPNFVNDSFNSD